MGVDRFGEPTPQALLGVFDEIGLYRYPEMTNRQLLRT